MHLFSGEKDVLAEALKRECDKARMQLYAEGIDRKVDVGVDLTSHETFDGIDKSIEAATGTDYTQVSPARPSAWSGGGKLKAEHHR